MDARARARAFFGCLPAWIASCHVCLRPQDVGAFFEKKEKSRRLTKQCKGWYLHWHGAWTWMRGGDMLCMQFKAGGDDGGLDDARCRSAAFTRKS